MNAHHLTCVLLHCFITHSSATFAKTIQHGRYSHAILQLKLSSSIWFISFFRKSKVLLPHNFSMGLLSWRSPWVSAALVSLKVSGRLAQSWARGLIGCRCGQAEGAWWPAGWTFSPWFGAEEDGIEAEIHLGLRFYRWWQHLRSLPFFLWCVFYGVLLQKYSFLIPRKKRCRMDGHWRKSLGSEVTTVGKESRLELDHVKV